MRVRVSATVIEDVTSRGLASQFRGDAEIAKTESAKKKARAAAKLYEKLAEYGEGYYELNKAEVEELLKECGMHSDPVDDPDPVRRRAYTRLYNGIHKKLDAEKSAKPAPKVKDGTPGPAKLAAMFG